MTHGFANVDFLITDPGNSIFTIIGVLPPLQNERSAFAEYSMPFFHEVICLLLNCFILYFLVEFKSIFYNIWKPIDALDYLMKLPLL
jgi:hypothetical protein